MVENNFFQVIPGFEDFLESIQAYESKNESFTKLIVTKERKYIMADGSRGVLPPKAIWYKDNEKIGLSAAKNIIKRALSKLNHRYSDEIASAILLIFATMPKQKNVVDTFKQIFDNVQTVSLAQYYLIPGKAVTDFVGFSFGDFTFGILDERKFEYRCNKATTDYYDLYKHTLNGRLCLERDFFEVNIVAWQALAHQLNFSSSQFTESILLYFEALSNLWFDEFWTVFVQQQSLQLAIGIPYIDPEIFRRFFSPEKISIFSRIHAFGRQVGYIVPEQQYIESFQVPATFNSQIKEFEYRLKNDYKFNIDGETELHKTVESYVKFLAKAHIHLHHERTNEAFLHFVIALDLLLGEKDASNKAISQRAAALTYRAFGVSFTDQKKKVQSIYDVRSKYVHAGKDVKKELLEETSTICRTVLDALLEVQRHSENHSFDKWVKKLDFAISSFEANVVLLESDLEKIGILQFDVK